MIQHSGKMVVSALGQCSLCIPLSSSLDHIDWHGKHVYVAKASELDKLITQKFQKNKDISNAILCLYTVL